MTFFKTLIASLATVTALSTLAVAGGDVEEVSAPAPVVVVESAKNFYAGISAQTVLDGRTTFELIDDKAYGLGLQAGYVFYRDGAFAAAVEGRYSNSYGDLNGADTAIFSGFIKPSYDLGVISVYGLVGYANVDIAAFSGSQSEFAYGAGASTGLGQDLELFVDYTTTPDFVAIPTTFDNEVVTVGLNYKF